MEKTTPTQPVPKESKSISMTKRFSFGKNVEHQFGITHLTAPHGDTIRAYFAESISFYRKAFGARLVQLSRDGDLLDLGPDYPARISALRSLANLCTRGRVILPPPQKIGGLTIPEWDLFLAALDNGYFGDDGPGPAELAKERERKEASEVIPYAELGGSSQPLNVADITITHELEIQELFALGLQSLAGCFEARKQKLTRDGEILDLGPDIKTGLAAADLLAQLATSGQKPIPAAVAPKNLTFPEIVYYIVGPSRIARFWEGKSLNGTD